MVMASGYMMKLIEKTESEGVYLVGSGDHVLNERRQSGS